MKHLDGRVDGVLRYKPWIAYSRTSHAGTNRGFLNSNPVDHATQDGITTLCGLKEIGGSNRDVLFIPNHVFACKRCTTKALATVSA